MAGVPYKCPECCQKPKRWFGRLVFDDQEGDPTCPNCHGLLVPVTGPNRVGVDSTHQIGPSHLTDSTSTDKVGNEPKLPRTEGGIRGLGTSLIPNSQEPRRHSRDFAVGSEDGITAPV